MGKIIITSITEKLLLFLMEGKRPLLISGIEQPRRETFLGNIYLARVSDVLPAMSGAFLSVSGDTVVFLPLSDKQRLLARGGYERDGILRQGDEVVIQIDREAIKNKPPSATGRLTLTGRYLVADFWGSGIRFSRKLSFSERDGLKQALSREQIPGRKKYGFTLRTNAGTLTDFTPVFQEMREFIQIFDHLDAVWRHRTCYSCLYRERLELVKKVQDISLSSYDEIITDSEDAYSVLKEAFPDGNIRFYRDDMVSLPALYSLDTHLKEALSKKVWLPGGGYLVIEPTEAMVVIDVNSGKGSRPAGRGTDSLYLRTNLEAAKEIARQLRLRNYSGMIMVDFINMESEADRQRLLESLADLLKEDKVPTRLVDMTALGIVEITRKKINRPLADFFALPVP